MGYGRAGPLQDEEAWPGRCCARLPAPDVANALTHGTILAEVFASIDRLRRAQGEALAALGFGPSECDFGIELSGADWRLRDYSPRDVGPALLIVAAPIKRPYLWDLAPSVSAVRYCQRHGLHVYLLEWMPPRPVDAPAGLAEYAGQAIGEAVAAISAAGARPCLMGHSLGGTLAAIVAALDPRKVSGLVLLGAPLCFQPGVSRFRDAIVAMAPPLSLKWRSFRVRSCRS